MEQLFKTLFTAAVIIFGLLFIGVFLLIIKIVLMFTPTVSILGLLIQ
ncbi:MAG: hypothetical protein WCK59_03230 [Candidatus Falkowbacteria bacterium]